MLKESIPGEVKFMFVETCRLFSISLLIYFFKKACFSYPNVDHIGGPFCGVSWKLLNSGKNPWLGQAKTFCIAMKFMNFQSTVVSVWRCDLLFCGLFFFFLKLSCELHCLVSSMQELKVNFIQCKDKSLVREILCLLCVLIWEQNHSVFTQSVRLCN